MRLASAPIVANGRVYTIDTLGAVRAFDARTGALYWASQTPDDKGNERSLYGGGIAYDNGRIYATNGLGYVSALDEQTGGIVWQVRPGGPLRGAPTVANGAVYVMSQDNQIYSLDETNGKTNWSEAASLEIAGVFGSASPAVGQGTVVAGFSSGELNAYRYENGRQVWQDALQRTSITTSVSSLSDIDADPVIDSGQVIARRPGRADGRARADHRPAPVGTQYCRHRDAVGGGRLGVRRHRRGQAAVHLSPERPHPLDQPAAAVRASQIQEGPDRLFGPASCRRPLDRRRLQRRIGQPRPATGNFQSQTKSAPG